MQVRAQVSTAHDVGAPVLAQSPTGAWPALLIEGPFALPSLKAGLLYTSGQGDPLLIIRNVTADVLTLSALRCSCRTVAFVSGQFREARVYTSLVSGSGYCTEEGTIEPPRTDFCLVPAVALAGVTERLYVNGSAQGWASAFTAITPNASLDIRGQSATPVLANAGCCNLQLPPAQAVPVPSSIAGTPAAESWVPPPARQVVSAQPCAFSGNPPAGSLALPAPAQAAIDAAAAATAAAGMVFNTTGLAGFEPSCGFQMQPNLTLGCDASQPGAQAAFDQQSGLAFAAAAAQPLPGPYAEQVLNSTLQAAGRYAAAAAAGNASAAALIVEPPGIEPSVDLLALLSVVAIRDGGRLGALAAAHATDWGAGTRFGPRDSYQRAIAILMNANDTEAVRNAFESAAEWDRTSQHGPGSWMLDVDTWTAGAIRGDCTGSQACFSNFGGVRTENATALLLAAGLALADGFFANVSTAATAATNCSAAQLAQRYGWGTAEEVLRRAGQVDNPAWLTCTSGACVGAACATDP
ncbi:hypothetical protein ABPG75_001952 [Micractinium tetrahymenae]